MRKVFKNIFASALPQIVNIVSNLILPGLIIGKFGSEINGLVSSTKTIISYISLVGAGIATAVTQALYKPVANNNIDETKGMLHAANKMFVKFGVIFCFVTLLVGFIYPFLIRSDIRYSTIVILLFVMSISGASEFFVTGRCRSLLYAKQQVYVSNIIQAVSLALSLIMALLMLKFDADIILVELAISLVYVMRAGFLLLYVNVKYPEYKGFRAAAPINKSVEKRNDALIHQLSGLVVTGSQSLILTITCGLHAASVYSVYFIVFNGLQSICANLGIAITPFLGKEIALGNGEKTKRIYNIIEYGFNELTTFLYSVTAVMIMPFIGLYTRGADINYLYKTFSLLFTFSSMLYILKIPSTNAVNAAGFFKETRWRALLEAAICLILSVACSLLLGQEGVLIGALVALGWRCVDTVVFANKYIISQSNRTSLFRLLKSVLIVSLFCFVSFFAPSVVNTYFEWVAYALIVSLISLFVVFFDTIVFEKTVLKDVARVVLRKEKN